MSEAAPRLRLARTDEAAAITELALRSKRLWGYDDDLMAAFTPSMTVTPADIEAGYVAVLDTGERLVGYVRILWRDDHAWLEDLFIDPDTVGSGYGRRLFDHARAEAGERGYEVLRLESDPNAVPFYRHLGAKRVGSSPSDAVEGRALPVMEIKLDEPA